MRRPLTGSVEAPERQVVVGETFAMDGPHYVAHVTAEHVFCPEACEEVPYSDGLYYNTFIGIQVDVDVESGTGEGSIPNGIEERIEDGCRISRSSPSRETGRKPPRRPLRLPETAPVTPAAPGALARPSCNRDDWRGRGARDVAASPKGLGLMSQNWLKRLGSVPDTMWPSKP